ncbi:hypothetical protein RJ640_000405 [Escallonia rubra]|uniref:C2 NT-type domain-containing protein n=1 Tax=Escallonia rubra TaxID=112253 RepID=A0AA88UI48_9ASTE|nr:hypothetical protein RJ640_000405 [Escallonia rubra]
MTRKFLVKVEKMRLLQGLEDGMEVRGEDRGEKVLAVQMRWKGAPRAGMVPFRRASRRRKDSSGERVAKPGAPVEWDDEFENLCCFSTVSGDDHVQNFGPWHVSFSLSYGESKEKMVVIGKASLNIAEMASNMESRVEKEVPIRLQVAGVARESTLLVFLSFAEIRDSQDSTGLVQNPIEVNGSANNGLLENEEERKNEQNHDEASVGQTDSDGNSETNSGNESRLSSSFGNRLDLVKKAPFFSWKRRRLSFKSEKIKTSEDENRNDIASTSAQNENVTKPTRTAYQSSTTSNWETRDLTSRDGSTKLRANVFFASFDQRSDKAAGGSACTALVAIIAHWLQSNQNMMPSRPEFDKLIIDGSSEWQKLCNNNAYVNDFPNKHFDLETILHADLRPIHVSREESYIGFFGPEKFESLKGAMSFDELWNEVETKADEHEPRIYIVSWNDHFFVLKADVNAYYIIDTLGERLFEGCEQAYILRFDESTSIHAKIKTQKVSAEEMAGQDTANSKEESEEIICSDRGCCKEYIKRFLAAIPLQELEQEEKKETVPYYSLHQRLQIEFNFTRSSSSSSSSPISSSATTSTSYLITDDECLDQL